MNIATFGIATPKNKKRKITTNTDMKVVSRLCKAIVAKENDTFVARISLCDDSDSPTILVIPFTPSSYDLTNKTCVFSVKPDLTGKQCCFIRDATHAKMSPGLPTQYTPLKQDIVVCGNIVSINNKHYFNYKDIVSFNYNHPDYFKQHIIENTPILLKKIN